MTSIAIRNRPSMRRTAGAVVLATALAWQVELHAQPAVDAAAVTQTSSQSGVTVKVTPRPAAGGAWDFLVTLDTHSASLDDDLLNSSVLVADGRELRPSGWNGVGPGGHHRSGVLTFGPVQGAKSIELRMQRAGEGAPRVFRWDAAAFR